MLACLAVTYSVHPQLIWAEAIYIIPSTSSSPSNNHMKHQFITWHGAVYSKPTCPAEASHPQIYVYPVHMLGYGLNGYLYGIAGINAYATDNGSSWEIKAEMRTLDGGYYADSTRVRVLAQIWCCKNLDCYDY